MSEQATNKLTRLLAADEREVGFLEYLPGDAVARVAGAVEKTIETEQQSIKTAIAEGVQRLPAGLRGIVGRILS